MLPVSIFNCTILKLQQRGSIVVHCSAAAEEAEASIVAMTKNAATHSAERGSGAALEHVVCMNWLTRDMHAHGLQECKRRVTRAHACTHARKDVTRLELDNLLDLAFISEEQQHIRGGWGWTLSIMQPLHVCALFQRRL